MVKFTALADERHGIEMDITAMFKLTYGLYVVGVKTESGYGGCIVDAFGQATVEPPMVLLCNNHGCYTNESIKREKEFTVSVLPEDVDPFVIANFGFQTGRETEKWANVPYELKDGLPVLKHAAAYLRCRVVEQKELSTHTLFICEVLDAWQGQGEPLVYGDYQKYMKGKTMEAFQSFKNGGKPPVQAEKPKGAVWKCSICGYVYDGDVPFEELPADWKCPICKMGKDVFVKEEA